MSSFSALYNNFLQSRGSQSGVIGSAFMQGMQAGQANKRLGLAQEADKRALERENQFNDAFSGGDHAKAGLIDPDRLSKLQTAEANRNKFAAEAYQKQGANAAQLLRQSVNELGQAQDIQRGAASIAMKLKGAQAQGVIPKAMNIPDPSEVFSNGGVRDQFLNGLESVTAEFEGQFAQADKLTTLQRNIAAITDDPAEQAALMRKAVLKPNSVTNISNSLPGGVKSKAGTELVGLRELKGQLDTLSTLATNPETQELDFDRFVGLFPAGENFILDKLDKIAPGSLDPEQQVRLDELKQFRDIAGEIKTVRLKELFGASQTTTELKNAADSVLSADMGSRQFRAGYSRLQRQTIAAMAVRETIMAPDGSLDPAQLDAAVKSRVGAERTKFFADNPNLTEAQLIEGAFERGLLSPKERLKAIRGAR